MSSDDLSFDVYDERFTDRLKAAEYLESLRWPDGPVCPHCGESERKPYKLPSETRRLYKCARCRKQYTVTVGTIFESSHIPLNKWLLAFYLLCSSKKGMSSHQLHRMLGVTYKTAWFMTHRIRAVKTAVVEWQRVEHGEREAKLKGQVSFHIQVEKDELDGGFVAECVDLPGCVSHGETEREAIENVVEAIVGVVEARLQPGCAGQAAQGRWHER